MQLQASGGVPPYTWFIQGLLPAGLSYLTSGLISGTPGPYSAGTAYLQLQLTDHAGTQVVGNNFSLQINNVGGSPSVSCTVSPPSPVSPGQTVTFSANGYGGTPPYTYSWSGGTVTGNTQSVYFQPPSTGTYYARIDIRDSVGHGNFNSCSETVQSGNGSTGAPLTSSPGSQGIVPGATASYSVTVGSNAAFAGTVSFAASNLPSGASAVFTPSTVSQSGTTALSIATGVSTPLGTFPVTITAQSGALSFSTIVSLTVAASTPATMLAPAPGTILTASTATLTWSTGSGASQYLLTLGSSQGASDILYANTGTITSATAYNVPAPSSPQTIYATLSSLISGSWQSRSYTYRVGPWPTMQPNATIPMAIQASGQQPTQLPCSQCVLNDGNPQTWPYCVSVGGSCVGDAGYIQSLSSPTASVSGVTAWISAIPSASYPSDPSSFDMTFTATDRTPPGPVEISNIVWEGAIDGNFVDVTLAPLPDAVTVYDATPVITPPILQYPPNSDGSFYISIYGYNFGQFPGSVQVCATGSYPCNSTTDVAVSLQGAQYFAWSDFQINALLTPAPTASGKTYNVRVTSGGAVPSVGFQAGGPGVSSAQSNPGQVTINGLKVSQSPGSFYMSTGDTGQVTVSGSPATAPLSVTYSSGVATSQPPGSACFPTLSIPNGSGTGSVVANVQVTSATSSCSGVLNIAAIVNSLYVAGGTVLTVPPQVMIWQMTNEAGDYNTSNDPTGIVQRSVAWAIRNRFSNPGGGFSGQTTYNGIAAIRVPSVQEAGTQCPTTPSDPNCPLTGVEPQLDNALSVFTAPASGDIVGGGVCYWSPQTTEWTTVQQALASPTTTFPMGLLNPSCYPAATRQIVWKTSMPLNIRGDTNLYQGAPAFLFIRTRDPSAPSVVQIP